MPKTALSSPPDAAPAQWLAGVCRLLLISPSGDVEGLLMSLGRRRVQVSTVGAQGLALARMTAPGLPLNLLAVPDHSPKTAQQAHPVFRLAGLADALGQPLPWPEAEQSRATLDGEVGHLHYARHGQPNGVVLVTGEFVHLRPAGMLATGLRPGDAVHARGRLGVTTINTRWMEARQVNGIDLV